MRYALVSLVMLSCSGCATFSEYVNRETSKSEVPLQVDGDDAWSHEHHRTSISNFTASRRAIVTSTDSVVDSKHTVFCAEPPPDAMTSALASDRLTAMEKKASGGERNADLASEYRLTAQGIAQRTPLVEIYRAAIFSMCQMYANGAIPKDNYSALFANLSKEVIDKIDGGPGGYPVPPGVSADDYATAVKARKTAEDNLEKAKVEAAKDSAECKEKLGKNDKDLTDAKKKCPAPATPEAIKKTSDVK